MNVQELIDELSKYPADMPVKARNESGNHKDIKLVEKKYMLPREPKEYEAVVLFLGMDIYPPSLRKKIDDESR